MTKLHALISIAAAFAAAGAASAQPAGGGEGASAAIRHADLNLSSASGVETFRGRVKAAANRICGAVPAQPADHARAVASCRAELTRSAEAQLAALGAASDEVAGTR
jgi:UrcA family protein